MGDVEPERLLDDGLALADRGADVERHLDAARQRSTRRLKLPHRAVESVDELPPVPVAAPRGRHDLAHQSADPLAVGEDLDVGIGNHGHRRWADEVGARLRHRPGEAVARPIDGEGGPQFDDGIADERLEERDHDLPVARRDRGGIDEGRGGDLVNRPILEAQRQPRHRRAPDGDAELGLEDDAGSADRIAVFRFDDDPAAAGADPHRQARRLGVVGEGGNEPGLSGGRCRIDAPIGARVVPIELPFPCDHQRRPSPLSPAGHPLDDEAERIQRRAARGIDRALAFEIDHRHSIPPPVQLHLDRRRALVSRAGLVGGMDPGGRLADTDERAERGERQPHRSLLRRQALDPHRRVDQGDTAIDPHEAFHVDLRQDAGPRRRGAPPRDPESRLPADPFADDAAPAPLVGLDARRKTDGLDGYYRLRPGSADHALGRRRDGQIEEERLAIGERLLGHDTAHGHRVPIVAAPRHPPAVAVGHGLASGPRALEEESPRPIDPRIGGEDQPTKSQRDVDPAVAQLADPEGDLNTTAIAPIAPIARVGTGLDDEALDDEGGGPGHAGQAVAQPEQFEKVAVLEAGHGDQTPPVVGQIEDLRGLLDRALSFALCACRLNALPPGRRRRGDTRAGPAANRPAAKGPGDRRDGDPPHCGRLRLWACPGKRPPGGRQQQQQEAHDHGMGRGDGSLPPRHHHPGGFRSTAQSNVIKGFSPRH